MIESQKNNDLSVQLFVAGVLFLATLNLFNKISYLIFFAFFIMLIFKNVKIVFDYKSIILILFSVSLIIFSRIYGFLNVGITTSISCFCYPLMYVMGYNICTKDDSENKFQNIMIFVGLGSFLHYILNMFINTEAEGRRAKDIWGAEFFSATGQAALCCIAIGIFGALIYSRRKIGNKIFAIAGLICILVYNLVLAGRTSLMLILVILLVGFGYYSVLYKTKRFKTIFPICLVALFLLLAIELNWFGIGDYFLDSNFFQRFTEQESFNNSSGRMDFKISYLKYIFVHIFGGGKIHKEVGRYAHDLLLDLYSDAGIITTVIMAVVLIISIKNVLKLLKSDCFSKDVKMLVFCIYLIIYIQFFLEPILAGMPWLLLLFLFYNGMIERRLELNKTEISI